ncbi:MAG: glycosyltransferase family 2 protein [Bacteroidota bacterium]|nr:glycosyltransferase family 2 protein [Bacteroidota bacterium]
MNQTYVILINFFGINDTRHCLESLLKLPENPNIIIVDNSVNDTQWNALCQMAVQLNEPYVLLDAKDISCATDKHRIALIRSEKNGGFAYGNNLGIRFAIKQEDCKYIWILNNDTEVDKKALSALLKMHQPKLILGSKLVYFHQKNLIQAVGGKFNSTFYICTHIGANKPFATPKSEFGNIDYPVGASIFVDRNFIKEVGLMCEDYFLYFEELDWIYRAKKKGYRLDWVEQSIVYHKEGASIGSSYNNQKSIQSEIQLFKSRKIFIQKNFGLDFKFYFSSVLLMLNRIRKGKFRVSKELFKITFNGN